MIGRRRFLGAASFGLISASLASPGLLAQDPRPKTKARSKSKTPSKAKTPFEGEAPLEADEQVNRILGQARTDDRRLPGMIGAIVRDEELSNIGAVGIRKIGSPDPIRIDDLVHLGSCTKAMTATMIGTLVDEGKLRWDSTIREVFPAWAERTHPDYATVTLNQLLSHRAGFPHDVNWWEAGQGRSVVEQRRALLSRALENAPETKPGSTYSYSNVGFVLAGMMAEQVTRTPWEDLMQTRLFNPLKMSTAGFGPPGTRGKVDHAWGHRALGNLVEAVHDDNDPSIGPAGTVHCSMRDWGKFASFHLKGSLGGVKLLKPETLKALHTPRPGEEYVGGWLVSSSGRPGSSGDILTHNGSNTFWYCTIWLNPDRGVGALVAVNAAGKPAEEACDQAIRGLLQYALPNDRPRRR
jgi:CubicO group peptidase (beta-lactamase class C family)